VSKAWLGLCASTTPLVSRVDVRLDRGLVLTTLVAGILGLTFPAMVTAMTQVGACKCIDRVTSSISIPLTDQNSLFLRRIEPDSLVHDLLLRPRDQAADT
jgi:hypothetical protein